jgi:serine O-acetyltransferase
MKRFCCNIPLTAIIEDIPEFPHGPDGVFISQGAKIGKNCVIFQQVTIGSNTLKYSKGFGDNIYIGVGAKIIGNIKIGSNVRIGANAVVVTAIDDNCTVVVNLPRIIT